MTQPQHRHDSYGRPLPELRLAEHESLLERPQNTDLRHFIHRVLEAHYQQLLLRGVHAVVSVRFSVQDGWMQEDIEVQVLRHWVEGRDALG